MDKIASASLNTFGISPKAAFVSPSEESVFIIYGSQLRDLITEAVQEAAQPLQDRIESLEDRTAALQEDNATMGRKLASLESLQEQDTTRILLSVAEDRRRLASLEKVEPQPMQKDRAEILRALLAANGGKMLAKDARQKMHLIKPRFSELLATMKDEIEIRPYHLRKNQRLLVLK